MSVEAVGLMCCDGGWWRPCNARSRPQHGTVAAMGIIHRSWIARLSVRHSAPTTLPDLPLVEHLTFRQAGLFLAGPCRVKCVRYCKEVIVS